MDIYSMGEEKCIDGVWGRELAGRFYTHSYNLYMCRLLNIHHPSKQWLTYVCPDGFELLDWYTIESSCQPVPYIPKHIKDLTNLKCGDIVWVFTEGSWKTVTFWYRTSTDITCVTEFSYSGLAYPHNVLIVQEVFIKRPFTI